jgi:putative ABC transport system ATP-binding protein
VSVADISPPAPLLALEGVHKRYAMGKQGVDALRGIDLRIQTGELVAIMGPSGSGKTTLMEILGCLSRPTAGAYRLGGRSIAGIDSDGLAKLRGENIGFVFQSFNLLPRLTVVENVELPLAYRQVPRCERRERALAALERVGLGHRARHLPMEVSGGERQRVAIARALVNRPSLVLADEPTGNLDSQTGGGILALLHSVHAEGNTVVIVTHDPAIGAQAQRQILLRDGRIESDARAH